VDHFSLNIGNHSFVRLEMDFPLGPWANLDAAAITSLYLLIVPEPNGVSGIDKGAIFNADECSCRYCQTR
jgi:hypothetical protein